MADINGRHPLAYLGVNAENPGNIYTFDSQPTTSDYKLFRIGAVWIYDDEAGTTEVYMLTKKQAGVATWLQLG